MVTLRLGLAHDIQYNVFKIITIELFADISVYNVVDNLTILNYFLYINLM